MASESIAEPNVTAGVAEYQGLVPRRMLVFAAGSVLTAIMLIAAFSLGVWWANGRETTQPTFGFNGGPPPGGAAGGGPGQQTQPFGGQQGNVPGAQTAPGGAQGGQTAPGAGAQNTAPPLTGAAVDKLPRSPDVVGTISVYSRNVLTVATRTGMRFVTVNAQTLIYRPDGTAGTEQALARGGGVAIVATPSPDGRSLVAEVVALLAPGN